jgi:hypothetical protein
VETGRHIGSHDFWRAQFQVGHVVVVIPTRGLDARRRAPYRCGSVCSTDYGRKVNPSVAAVAELLLGESLPRFAGAGQGRDRA